MRLSLCKVDWETCKLLFKAVRFRASDEISKFVLVYFLSLEYFIFWF